MRDQLQHIRRLAFAVTLVVVGGACLGLGGLPALLLLIAETWGGRLVGAAFLLLAFLPAVLWFGMRRRSRRLAVGGAVGVGAAALGLLTWAYLLSPRGDTADSRFSQRFLGREAFCRASLPNIVPEVDQLKLGACLFSVVDPHIGLRKGARVQRVFLEIYRDMRRDRAFREAGSVLGRCYSDLFSFSHVQRAVELRNEGPGRYLQGGSGPSVADSLHVYQYLPNGVGGGPYPVIVFLHGSLGNFKGYMWVLKKLADQKGMVIVAPTYGCGAWYTDRQSSVLNAVHDYCVDSPDLDAGDVYLAGLSNGGTGMTRGIRNVGERYKGFIFLSAVIEQSVITTPEFLAKARGKPTLIVHGDADARIPIRYIQADEALLRQGGVPLTSRYYPGEDHFLFFSKPDEVVADIAQWLDGI